MQYVSHVSYNVLLKYNNVDPTYKMVRPVHEKAWRIMLKQLEMNARHRLFDVINMEVRKKLAVMVLCDGYCYFQVFLCVSID